MSNMFSILQIDQVTGLANEGVSSISAIENPADRVLFIVLIILLVLAVTFIWALLKLKFKDVEQKEETIKKKDTQLEKKTSELINLGHTYMEHQNKFGQSVDRLTQTLMLMDERQRLDHDNLLDQVKTSTSYFKLEVDKIKNRLNTRTA